jgi:hypothetical protein
VTRSVEGLTAGEALLDEILTGQAAHAAVLARGRPSAEAAQIVWVQGGARRAINVEGMDVCAARGPGATPCAPAVPARGRSPVPDPARAQCRIRHTRGTVGAEAGPGRLAEGEEAIVGTISGTAGLDHPRLCNTYFLALSSHLAVLFSFTDYHIKNVALFHFRPLDRHTYTVLSVISCTG